jgi:hypothetical protein
MGKRLTFTLSIECESPAFKNANGVDIAGMEVGRILRRLGDDQLPLSPTNLLVKGKWPMKRLTDEAGNTVGWAEFEMIDTDDDIVRLRKLVQMMRLGNPDLIEKYEDLIWQSEN